MKKFIGWIIIILCSLVLLFFISKNNNEYSINCNDKDIRVKLKYKGLENSVDFSKDENNNYYVAFKDKIVVIEEDGVSYVLLDDKSYDISSIDFFKDNLYIATGDKVVELNIKSKNITECIKDIPNYGDYNKVLVRVKGEYLFVTIGSATNSGVVGPDNKWVSDYPNHHDITPRKIILKGGNFGLSNNGAFVANNTSNIKGQIMEGSKVGNSTLLIYNINTKAYETFAWGIRNINGFDFSSDGKIYATVGGMENRGYRPIYNDSDYIFEIKKNNWYGFPDFSGGDPVTSPRFSDDKSEPIDFLMEKHPTNNPSGPVYQHNEVSTLGSLCIDTSGDFKIKDAIYFYDKKNNNILDMPFKGKPKVFVNFGDKTKIMSMKIIDGELLILESNQGEIYSLSSKNSNESKYLKNNLYISLLTFTVTLIISIVALFLKKNA